MTLQRKIKTENSIVKSVITIIVGLGISIFFSASPVKAQPDDREILPLNEQDYACLQVLDCVVESRELKEKGWHVKFDETVQDYPQARTARLKGDGLFVTAHYDKDGKLIKGIYNLKNTALPRVLLSHLAGNSFDGWQMTGNEITVYDFNISSTKYKVMLENGTDKKIVSFSYSDVLDLTLNAEENLVKNQY